MANWNKRRPYQKESKQSPQSMTPWEKMQQASNGNSVEQEVQSKNQPKKKKREKKVVSMEDKLPRLKELRRKKMYRRLCTLIFLFSFAIFLIVYFISPFSRIETISVVGANEVTDQAVIDASRLKSGDSLWSNFFERKKIAQKIENQLEQVKSATLQFDGLNSFKIAVKEYKTVAYLAKDNEYHNILENGKIVKESRKVSIGNPPIFVDFKEGPALDEMILQYSQLSTNIKNSISEIQFTQSDSDDYLITLNMNDGNQVVASIPSFAEQMAYYPDTVKKIDGQKGIINMEVGIFFKPFEEKAK
ncbi:cell division protein FtsQ [Carnobacterium maltaromaticum]|uniref:cell division protein FtsQ/DivIB n=1 Tax=Carnobacterium maltaromaticum TaxID=2751 RepID=UPI000C75CDE2|nr:FtsQ-type POTRA domain-containing protein [Carnobacterium maltaromaticum]PLS33800.1 cell division protein FtsQ [Carnobacterium maltaromaticum]PLS35782.1 cell division protein FtsQ [Carnobacterium maltaromaticum]PLS36231.1 cell division protein FtsQ [Carnobacterium maltaromaticum]PLS42688.1 cell division protein FtsQ [Carnobacterium maltaromaticum]PLS42924.1 cell division protein FtsQ [Carnobacterium maltaromaticum]